MFLLQRLSEPKRRLIAWCGGLALLYGLCLFLLFVLQRQFMYFPDPVPIQPAAWALPELRPLEVQTADPLSLRGWYVPPRQSRAVTVVFMQGNGGHLGMRNYKIRSWIDAGYGVVLVGYRGYGNPGAPSETGLYEDAKATIEAARAHGLPVEKMVFYGESLGTGVAVQMALAYAGARGLILEAPYSSMPDVGAVHYPLVPVAWLLKDKYNSLSKIGAVRLPLLLLHGEADRIVPVRMGRKLFEAANEPKQASFQPGAGHNDLYGAAVQKAVLGFLAERSR